MKAYYNEFDKNAAAWLRELIKRGLIADGIVDERSITEVTADDLRGFTQCHFFAGIGGWSYALRLAGVQDNYPVWTASLPCQPFSAAGKQLGKADERHLLPHFLELVRQRQPDRIFGEQVEGAIRHGWLDDLQATMEAEGYAVGHCVLGAHSVGSFHQRQRLYWVANSNNQRGRGESCRSGDTGARSWAESGRRSGIDDGMAYSGSKRHQEQPGLKGISRQADAGTEGENAERGGSMGDTELFRRKREQIKQCSGIQQTVARKTKPLKPVSTYGAGADEWLNPEWIYCRDNKYRPIKPGLKPLVNGIPRGVVRGGDNSEPINANETAEARAMRLKGYGNAIVPQVAAEFIGAFMDVSA